MTGPAADAKYHTHLVRGRTRLADDVSPTVAKHGGTVDDRPVVPTEIATSVLGRMRLQPVEFTTAAYFG